MKQRSAQLKKTFFDHLLRKRHFKTIAFIRNLPLLLGIIGGVSTIHANNGDVSLLILQSIGAALLVVWWAINCWDSYQDAKSEQ